MVKQGSGTRGVVLGLGLMLVLGGCTSLLQKDAPRREQILIESGFRMMPADTPEKTAQLQALPPYTILKQVKNGTVRYVYADPTGCQCVYVGNAEQYGLYKQSLSQTSVAEADRLEERMATEEQAEAIEDAWDPL